jgi:type I restriction enzyme R subunit
MPIFRMLKTELYGDAALNDDAIALLVTLTQGLCDEIERELRLVGFWESIPARNKLKADLQRTLLQPEFMGLGRPPRVDRRILSEHAPEVMRVRARIVSRLMEIAEKNNDTILYAS